MSEDANDVTKALAAFGAPLIRYHSFGQAQLRSNMIHPRRPSAATLPPVLVNDDGSPVMTQQEEPVAAPEPIPISRMPPHALPVPPVASTVLPSPQVSTVAPPPRPLAEWAAPVSGGRTGPMAMAPVSAEPRPAPPFAASEPLPGPVAVPGVQALQANAGTPIVARSLPEVFEFLAAS